MSSPLDMQPEDDKKKNINGHCKNSPTVTNIMSQKRRSENGNSEAQEIEGKTTLSSFCSAPISGTGCIGVLITFFVRVYQN